MKFSVVVINHNYGRFLGQAITSALRQTHGEREVIVVDDGSSDGSRAVIESFGDAVTAIFQPQGGHVRAVNAGFAAASGEGVVFLDADDFLYPSFLAQAAEQWDDDLAKLQVRLDTVDETGQNQNTPFPYFPDDLSPEQILRQSLEFGFYPWTVSSGNVFSTRYLAQVMPIDADVIYRSPDGYLSRMAPLFGDVKSSGEILGAYRVHGANTWARAGRSLRAYPANRWVAFDRVLCKAFNEKAAALGHAPHDYDELVSLQRIEHRLMGLRSDPKNYPIRGDTPARLFQLGRRCACHAPNVSAPGRIVWLVWFATLAFAPYWLVDRLYRAARTQRGRSPVARLLVRFARGPAALGRTQT